MKNYILPFIISALHLSNSFSQNSSDSPKHLAQDSTRRPKITMYIIGGNGGNNYSGSYSGGPFNQNPPIGQPGYTGMGGRDLTPGSVSSIKGFVINNDGSNVIPNGKRYKNLSPYIKPDSEAMKLLTKTQRQKSWSGRSWLVTLGVFLIGANMWDSADKHHSPTAGLIAISSVTLGIGSFASGVILRSKSIRTFRKTIITYNRNAGYGEGVFAY